jgi:hypothetical protein
MYKYLTRIKDKHQYVTHEFQVNPENHMLRNACKMHMEILLYFIIATTADLLTIHLNHEGEFFCSFGEQNISLPYI